MSNFAEKSFDFRKQFQTFSIYQKCVVAIFLFIVYFVATDRTWAVVSLFLLGKLGITSAFSTSYVHTAEMMPTVIRSIAVGSASTVARLGALVAPFVPLLVRVCRFFFYYLYLTGFMWGVMVVFLIDFTSFSNITLCIIRFYSLHGNELIYHLFTML